jgi:hypothetical protein
MQNVSATGLKIRLVAIPTFPAGFDITQFADDADPISTDSVDIAGAEAALNGDLVTWSRPNIVNARINVLPGTDEAKNLDILWAVNRTGKNKLSAQDKISMVINYPNGDTKILSNGAMISGVPFDGGSSEGRLNTREYGFAFQDVI